MAVQSIWTPHTGYFRGVLLPFMGALGRQSSWPTSLSLSHGQRNPEACIPSYLPPCVLPYLLCSPNLKVVW